MGNFNNVTFKNSALCNSIFHRISFCHVIFDGTVTLNNTSIYSPSKCFDISFSSSVDNINVDAKCTVTAFSYFDKINLTIEEWFKYKIFLSYRHQEVANTFFMIDQIWCENHIRDALNNHANLYFQRKKAETRSLTKFSKLTGYLSEYIIGYGEKPFLALVSMAVIIFLFSFVYLFTGFTPSSECTEIHYSLINLFDISLSDYWESLYYSFITLITVGQGTATPSTQLSQFAMCLELLIGAILMSLFTGTLFRKYTK